MSEITLTQSQLEDSFAVLETATDSAQRQAEVQYVADTSQVPRPDFASFRMQIDNIAAMHRQPPANVRGDGRVTIKHPHGQYVTGHEGIRGFAVTASLDNTGNRQLRTNPAILLPGAKSVAVLTAEPDAATITETQHALLDSEYIKSLANIKQQHSTQDITNAGDIAPSLMVASSAIGSNPHGDMHSLAGDFGRNFSTAKRQDITIGHNTRHVRSTVLPLSKVAFLAGPGDQLPKEEALLGIRLSSGQLAVGLTLAASNSRLTGNPAARLRSNLTAIVQA